MNTFLLSISLAFFLLGCPPQQNTTNKETGNSGTIQPQPETSYDDEDEQDSTAGGVTTRSRKGARGSSSGSTSGSLGAPSTNPTIPGNTGLPYISGTVPNASKPVSDVVHVLHITREALNDIQKYIANQDLMRGGQLFGYLKDKEAYIEYFLYDYGGTASGGSYGPGKNRRLHANAALTYTNENGKTLSALGGIHSKPGAMNYLFSNNDAVIDSEITSKPNVYPVHVLAIVTRGTETMKTLHANEITLHGDAKVSFFVKKDVGTTSLQIGKIDAYKSAINYEKMNSFIIAQSLLHDVAKDIYNVNLTKGRSEGNNWLFDIEFPTKKTLQLKIDWAFPQSAPTLTCYKNGVKGPDITAPNWVLDTKDFSTFNAFLDEFIKNHWC